jgi:hypothetical protein
MTIFLGENARLIYLDEGKDVLAGDKHINSSPENGL